MKLKTLALASVLTLAGCQSMIVTETPDGVKTKTPTSLVAVQTASANVQSCRLAVLQSQVNAISKIDGDTEAGRMQILMMSMLQKDQLAQCDNVVSEVAAQFNATDRSRLSTISKGIGVGGAVAGGYIMGQALEGIASAGATRVNATNSNVAVVDSVRVNGGGGSSSEGLVEGSDTLSIGSNNSASTLSSNFVSGDKSSSAVSPVDSAVGDGRFDISTEFITDLE